ncbi:MAG: RNA 2',3'-cyclic phosphodiesterase [Candidatus Omnitrophota bacterium]|jgi:2'-5' RNA ligase
MRAFIAIRLSVEVEDFLSRIQEKLKASGADVKWIEPRNIHLTLKFLGERDDKRIEETRTALEETAARSKEYILQPSSIGAFPDIRHPSVIWAGVSQGAPETIKLALDIEEGICRIGIPKEKRPFTCHITLGRSRTPKNIQGLVEQLSILKEGLLEHAPAMRVDKITLFKSTLSSKGPLYEVLHEANLKKT